MRGYRLKLTAHLEANPDDPESLILAKNRIAALKAQMANDGFVLIAEDCKWKSKLPGSL
jgi:hypothetical protein